MIKNNELIIRESPDYEEQQAYSIRIKTEDSGGLSYQKSFTLNVNDIDESILDIDGNGFVDGVTNYQMWTSSGAVELKNRRGKTYSDNTSKMWDLTKAIESDPGFLILLEGDRSKDGKFRVVAARDTGVISGATRWMNDRQMFRNGYEEIFEMDFNGNNIIDSFQ